MPQVSKAQLGVTSEEEDQDRMGTPGRSTDLRALFQEEGTGRDKLEIRHTAHDTSENNTRCRS